MIPQVVASERGEAQTMLSNWYGVVGLHKLEISDKNDLGKSAKEGESPVLEANQKR